MSVELSYDPAKRQWTLDRRRLDFEDARRVFAGPVLEMFDERFDYGEDRWITMGLLYDAAIVIIWTGDDDQRRIISMRKATADEQRQYYAER